MHARSVDLRDEDSMDRRMHVGRHKDGDAGANSILCTGTIVWIWFAHALTERDSFPCTYAESRASRVFTALPRCHQHEGRAAVAGPGPTSRECCSAAECLGCSTLHRNWEALACGFRPPAFSPRRAHAFADRKPRWLRSARLSRSCSRRSLALLTFCRRRCLRRRSASLQCTSTCPRLLHPAFAHPVHVSGRLRLVFTGCVALQVHQGGSGCSQESVARD